ncbi:MAG: hypothetical protein Q8K60_03385 [Parachlamydiaceae bacterium]|nr:hypothetical protein [Parachlamydiaceae bacterium]
MIEYREVNDEKIIHRWINVYKDNQLIGEINEHKSGWIFLSDDHHVMVDELGQLKELIENEF